MKNVLFFDEEQANNMKKEIEDEIKSGEISDDDDEQQGQNNQPDEPEVPNQY